MPDTPADILGEAEDALGAVTDLLCCITQDDLHVVHPGRLYSLLELVRAHIHCARMRLAERA